ncbi:MAG TPA: glycosyltransferase family 39 protein [Actinospica sp.]|nr:glycosyltransferase family 39 protein [Actinospica sp.]
MTPTPDEPDAFAETQLLPKFTVPEQTPRKGSEAAEAAPKPAAKPDPKPRAKPEPETESKTAAKPASKKTAGFMDAPEWRESVPFDETGVLLRPESLRQHAMQAETELMSVVKEAPDDGSDTAQPERSGFWSANWTRRALVAAILLVQALLTLRNNNTAFEDEALYLYSGHLELGHLMYGTSTGADFWSYFSGAPTLYPVLGAIVDQIGGLFAARLLSLAFMLGVTGLLYLLTRQLFGTRAAVCAAAVYCCGEGTVFVGGLATYDAPALFLLALAAWIVVRFGKSSLPLYLMAAFPAALAVGTKYAALMFVPVVIALALFAALPRFGGWAWIRPVALSIATSLLIYTEIRIAGPDALTGVQSTTTNRAQGTDSAMYILQYAGEWGGCVFAIALLGAFFLYRLPSTHANSSLPGPRWQRLGLGVLLAGAGLLAPAYQVHLHTAVSLQKHVAFGLFFAAPLAGYGLVRLVGRNYHLLQLGIAAATLTLALGMGQSIAMFHVWPNSDEMLAQLVKYEQPNAHYLVSADEVAIYGLRGDTDTEPAQFSNTFYFLYTTSKGQQLTGLPAYSAAIADGYFRIVVYTGEDDPATETVIAQDLARNHAYKLVAKIPEPIDYQQTSGITYYYVWVHT